MKIAIYIVVVIALQNIFNKMNIKIQQKTLLLGFNIIILMFSILLSLSLYTLGGGKNTTGQNLYFIPVFISIFSVITFIKIWNYEIEKSNDITNNEMSFKDMISMSIPAIALVFAEYAFTIPLYAPRIFNTAEHSPSIAVTLYSLLSVLFSIGVFYDMQTNRNSYAKSLSMSLIPYFILQTTMCCLILLYGLIENYGVSYTFWGGILTISFAPILIVLCNILKKPKNNILV